MTEHLNLILQNRLLTEEVKRRVDQLAAINAVATTVSQSLDLNRTLETALQVVLEIVEAEAGGISLIDEAAQEVVLRAQHGWTQDFVSQPMRIPFGQGMSGRVIKTDKLIVNNDFDGSEELAVPRVHDEHFRSIAMAPMHARGKVVGILSIMSSRPGSFSDEITSVLEAIADTVGVALDNSRLYETTVEKENSLEAILHATADGIIAADQDGRIRLINHTAEIMFGVESESLIGTPLREIPIESPIRNSLLAALSVRAESQNESFEVGTEKILLVTVSPVFAERQVDQGIQDGWVIVLRDVTHLRQAEIARAQFIQAAAHDMRNPLGLTMNSLALLENVIAPDQTRAHEIIHLATKGVDRLHALINDLMNLEQIESGYGLHETDLDLTEVIREASAQIQPIMDDKSLTYRFEFDRNGPLPLIHADRNLLMRALLNYLDNAAKYTGVGGSVTLHAFKQDGKIHIEVTDSGPGITPEVQARLFERFYRAPEVENIPGTGLGLAIVKSVANRSGGSVYVRSRLGYGSTFGMTLTIPLG